MAPAISVIMPLFNRAATVERACRSVLEQSVADLELIVVDDGSSDDGPGRVEAIGDPRIRLLRFAGNRGANAARNEGMRQSRAPLLSFLDSDDLFLPDKLETVERIFADRPDVGAVIDSFRSVERRDADKDCRNPALGDSEAVVEQLFTRRIWKSVSGISVRRDTALAIGGFDEALRRRQDFDFLLRLARVATIVSIPQITWLKAYSDDGITRDLGRFMADFVAFWDRHPEFYATPAYRRGFGADLARHFGKLVIRRRFDLLPRDLELVRERIGWAGIARSIASGAGELHRLRRYRRGRK